MFDAYTATANSHTKLQRGQVWCKTCGKSEQVDAQWCLRYGWPKCCDETMTIDSPAERQQLASA